MKNLEFLNILIEILILFKCYKMLSYFWTKSLQIYKKFGNMHLDRARWGKPPKSSYFLKIIVENSKEPGIFNNFHES